MGFSSVFERLETTYKVIICALGDYQTRVFDGRPRCWIAQSVAKQEGNRLLLKPA